MRTPIYRYINIQIFALLFLVMGMVGEGYGQRVYANAQQSSPKQSLLVTLSEVTNQGNAIDTDTTKFSTLGVTLGALGAITAHQNLQFNGVIKPQINSPVIIKIQTTSSILTLLDGISVQRTIGGRTGTVNPVYTKSQLLNLLNLLEGTNTATVIIPPNGISFDGVRLEINTTVGLFLSANYYYAFYITPPLLNSFQICIDKQNEVIIDNYQVGYTYKVYNAEILGTEMNSVLISTDKITLPNSLPVGTHTFWLEAREGNLYPSARTAFTVTVLPKRPAPVLNINPNSQY